MTPGTLVKILECGIFEGQYGIVLSTDIFPGTGEGYANVFVDGDVYPFIFPFILRIKR